MNISVIVPVFNHWHLVPGLIAALSAQSLDCRTIEVFLVDNNSDVIPEDIELPPWAHMLKCTAPGSYAARNLGLEHARGRWIAFTDADCRPAPDWLKNALDRLAANERDDTIVAGNIVIEPGDWDNLTRAEMYDVALGLPQKRYVGRGYAVTANLVVPRKIIDAVGGFNHKRFSGGDAEFCRTAVASGFHLTYAPDVEVTHPARTNVSELITKRRRVKGGQICAGPFNRRFLYGVRTFMPPVFAMTHALQSKRLPPRQRLNVFAFVVLLWFVDMRETVRLLLGGKPERR